MAKNSLIYVDCNEDSDEGIGVYEQGDCSPCSPDDVFLPPIQLLQKYAKSGNVYDRQMVARKVQEIFRTVPADRLVGDLPEILTILTNISDESMLRADLLEQIPHIAAQATECSSKCSEFKNIVSECLISLVVRNLGSNDTSVDKAAHSALIQLIEQGFINNLQVEIKVCPSILAISNFECVPEVTAGSVTLMCKLAPLLGRDVTERVFLKRFSELCTNEQFLVRKVCSSHIGDLCAVVGKDAFEKVLLPSYIKLCSDETWGVRKASAEVIMFVSWACPPPARRSILSPVFIKLLQDECRWVRSSAFHTLGPFISTFATPTVLSVSYNNMGDLVLVNGNGNEFLMNAPPIPDNRSPFLQKLILSAANDKDDADVIMNPLDFFNSSKDFLESEINQDAADLSDNNENVVLLEPPPLESDEDIKEIVETVKNAVLSYRTETNDLKTNLSNGNVINDIKQCDNLDSSIEKLADDVKNVNVNKSEDILNIETDVNWNIGNSHLKNDNCNIPEIKKEFVNKEESKQVNNSESELEDDNLQLFNSYNYWYIKPELPLDPDILDGLTNAGHVGADVSSNLEDLYSNVNLSDTFNYSVENTGIDHWTDESNENNSNESQEEKKPTQDIVPQMLVDHFIFMTDPTLSLTLDNEMTYHCAYSLPAVAVTLGNENWILLKETVETLAIDLQYKVRRTVASSLHELASILGPEVATDNLTPLFDGFIKDLDEVRIGVLKHLAHFLKLINVNKRNAYLPRLEEFMQTDNESNWRFRQELGNQLLEAVPLFRPNDIAKYVGRIAQDLLCDKVAAVRQVAISLIIEIIKHISSEPGLTPHLLIKLAERFAHSKMWKRRQTFALLCSELLSHQAIPAEQFASEVMPHLLDLSWDPVANVRLVVARIISNYIITNEYFCNPKNRYYDGVNTVLKRLQADKDRDVRQSAFVEHTSVPTY